MQWYAFLCFISPDLCLANSATFTASQWALEANHTQTHSVHIYTPSMTHASGYLALTCWQQSVSHHIVCMIPNSSPNKSYKAYFTATYSFLSALTLFSHYAGPIMLSCCQAKEVSLSRQLICLLLSLAVSPWSNPQIHPPHTNMHANTDTHTQTNEPHTHTHWFHVTAVWQWCMKQPPLVWFKINKLWIPYCHTMTSYGGHWLGLMGSDTVFLHCFESDPTRQTHCLRWQIWRRADSVWEGQEILSVIWLSSWLSDLFWIIHGDCYNLQLFKANKTISPQCLSVSISLLVVLFSVQSELPYCYWLTVPEIKHIFLIQFFIHHDHHHFKRRGFGEWK